MQTETLQMTFAHLQKAIRSEKKRGISICLSWRVIIIQNQILLSSSWENLDVVGKASILPNSQASFLHQLAIIIMRGTPIKC